MISKLNQVIVIEKQQPNQFVCKFYFSYFTWKNVKIRFSKEIWFQTMENINLVLNLRLKTQVLGRSSFLSCFLL